MQAEYIKEWMDTYLWILPEQNSPESYEEKMIQCNSDEGWLMCSRQNKNGEEYFCYKVTGKKALHSIYAALPMGERQIRSILGQIFAILEKGKEYLLSEDDFLLEPHYIFATLPYMTLELCYMPGYKIPLRNQLEGLFEYLLNRVDYEDKQAVNLVYDCYMFCMREKGGLAEIKKLLAEDMKDSKKNGSFYRTTFAGTTIVRGSTAGKNSKIHRDNKKKSGLYGSEGRYEKIRIFILYVLAGGKNISVEASGAGFGGRGGRTL